MREKEEKQLRLETNKTRKKGEKSRKIGKLSQYVKKVFTREIFFFSYNWLFLMALRLLQRLRLTNYGFQD